MNFQVLFLEDAEQDINDIEEYLSQFYCSTVRNFILKLENSVFALSDMPYLYPEYDEDPYFRRMVVNDYLLFYSVDEKRRLVVIHRIIHSKRDISREILARRTQEYI